MRKSRLVDQPDLLIALLAGVSVLVYVVAAAIMDRVGFPLDDAWIHQTYARNLARHGEWAFVPGQTSTASTSPLYTLLLAVGYILHIPFFAWTFALGMVTLAGAGWLGRRLAAILFPDLPALWTGLAMVLAWHLVWAASSGMETMLFCTLSLLVVWMAWRGMAWREMAWRGQNSELLSPSALASRGFWFGLAGAALTLTRPEGLGLVGLAAGAVLVSQPRRNWLAWGGGVAAGWLLGAAPYIAWNYHISGDFLPSTASAKQAEYAVYLKLPLWKRYWRLLLPVIAGGQFLLLPGVAMALITLVKEHKDRRILLLMLPFAWIFVHLSAYALRLPVSYQHGRYVIPILPHLLLYGVGGTLQIVRAGRFGPVQRVLSRSLALSAALTMVGFWILGARIYGTDVRIINTEMVDTARWIEDNLPSDQLLAVHDIGALGYYAPRPILDLAGLVSPEVVPIIRDHDAIMRLMCQRHVHYMMAFSDQLPVPADDPRLGEMPLFTTHARFAPAAGGSNMAVYELHWQASCN